MAGGVTVLDGVFAERGVLRVDTSPAQPSTIKVNGFPRDKYGVWTFVPAGSYEVCFGPVPSMTAPGCETIEVTAGG
ncbi:MAG: hypothetical protein ACKVIY_07820, partial [Acidimicrobiales bacterium]